MFTKTLSAAAAVLAASSLVSAQTHSLCNPYKGAKCAPDPAAPETVNVDFTAGPNDFFELAGGTDLTYGPDGAVFSISKDGQAPTITSKGYMFFGRLDVVMKAAPGQGIVSSIVLQSDDLDEVDWEWVGADHAQAQTNYFSKGDDSTYDRGGFSPVADPQAQWHKYSIDWSATELKWLIDDKVVRSLPFNGDKYPQTPMQIKLGTWIGGAPGAPQGRIDWAGGLANMANGPFNAYIKSISMINTSNGKKGAVEYSYSDSTGSMGSINVKTDGSSGGGSKDVTVSSSGTITTTTTSSSSGGAVTTSSTMTTVTTSTRSSNQTTTTSTSTTASNTGGSQTTSAPTTRPTNAAGKLDLSNFALLGGAVFMGALML